MQWRVPSRQTQPGAAQAHPLGRPVMKLWALAAWAAATISSRLHPGLPKRMLSAMVVANSVGSWLTSPSCARRWRSCGCGRGRGRAGS